MGVQIFAMTLRLSALFEEQFKGVVKDHHHHQGAQQQHADRRQRRRRRGDELKSAALFSLFFQPQLVWILSDQLC